MDEKLIDKFRERVNENYFVLHITKDENLNSIEVYTFLSCIDMFWEFIQQLHRVFYDMTDIPFIKEKKIFDNNQFSMDDNNFFKTVRACPWTDSQNSTNALDVYWEL